MGTINTSKHAASRIAGRALRRRVDQVKASEALADHIDGEFDALWKRVLWALQFVRPFQTLFNQLKETFARLDALPGFMKTELANATKAGYQHGGEDVSHTVLRVTKERIVIQPHDIAKLWSSLAALGAKPVRDAVSDMMFPALGETTVNRIVELGGWEQRLRTLTKLGNPAQLATTIAQRITAGGGINQVARDLLPQLNGVRSSARRVARTEYLRVVQTAQYEAYEQIGDLIVGYQVHGIMDDRIRPLHRERNGTVYYKQPTSGRLGMNLCPHPPLESDGSVAHNCRCFITPVFDDEPHGITGVGIHKTPQYDPSTVASWYDTADEGTRRAAVGATRYNVAADMLQRPPRWNELLHEDGQIATYQQLIAKFRNNPLAF